jgi:hypothetical protein
VRLIRRDGLRDGRLIGRPTVARRVTAYMSPLHSPWALDTETDRSLVDTESIDAAAEQLIASAVPRAVRPCVHTRF